MHVWVQVVTAAVGRMSLCAVIHDYNYYYYYYYY